MAEFEPANTELAPIPRQLAKLNNQQRKDIRSILQALGIDLARIAQNIEREDQIQQIRPQLRTAVSVNMSRLSNIVAQASLKGREISITSDIEKYQNSRLTKVAYNEFRQYLETTQDLLNQSVADYLEEKSRIDGRSLAYRFKTIQEGTDDVVEAIIRVGIQDGKSPFQIGKEIENYIYKDNRKRWTSPWKLLRREKGFPISVPYTGDVPAGSVDYNAARIARTELINNHRWAKIDSTKNKDWVIGWRWQLSHAHPKPDICDIWASHDEGLGAGVYSDALKISGLGHPHCFCQVNTVTIFEERYRNYFEQAKKQNIVNLDKYSVNI